MDRGDSRGLVATALGAVVPRLDGYDTVFGAGLLTLAGGLWLWLGLGVALTVAGGIVIGLGLLAAARDVRAPDQTTAGGGGEPGT